MATEQPCKPLACKPLAPPIDEAVGAVELVADRSPGMAGIEQQDQACAPGIVGSAGLTRRSLGELGSFHFGQGDRAAHGTTILAFQQLQSTSNLVRAFDPDAHTRGIDARCYDQVVFHA